MCFVGAKYAKNAFVTLLGQLTALSLDLRGLTSKGGKG